MTTRSSEPPAWNSWARQNVALLVGVSGAMLYAARTPPAAWTALWAEDGAVFLQAAFDHGGLAALFDPYAGYLHLVPRLIAAITVVFPISWWPTVTVVLCGLVAGLVVCAVFLATASLSIRTSTRIGIAAITVLAPALGYEVLGNTANLHTLLLWAAPWVFLVKPKSRFQAISWAVVVFGVVATEIQAAIFLPLLIWAWRDRMRIPLRIAAAVAFAGQLWAMSVSHRAGEGTPIDFLSWFNGFFLQSVMTAFIGAVRVNAMIVATAGWWAAYVAVIPFVVATIVLWRYVARRSGRFALIYLWVAAVGIWTAGFVLNVTGGVAYALMSSEKLREVDQLRYGVVPSMLLLSLLVLLLDRGLIAVTWPRAWRPLLAVVLGLVATGSFGLGLFSPHQKATSWSAELEFAATECVAEPSPNFATLKVAPEFMYWTMTIPCELIERR